MNVRSISFSNHNNTRAPCEPRKHTCKIATVESNASSCRQETGSREVYEHCAPSRMEPRAIIMANDHDNIIEVIATPHAVCHRRMRQADKLVIVTIIRPFAPAVITTQVSERKHGPGTTSAIRAIEHIPDRKAADRGRTITFTFQGSWHQSRAPERTQNREACDRGSATCRALRKGSDHKI